MNIRLNFSLLAMAMALFLAAGIGKAKEQDPETHNHAQQMQHQDHAEHAQHQAREPQRPHENHAHQMPPISGEDPHAHHRAMLNKPGGAVKSTIVDLRDHRLLNQHGRQVGLVADVVGDKIVVMDFVYTTCTTICPVLTAVMGQVQERVVEDLGKDVALVSVTVDATRDTPQRLKAYAASHGARQGWSWITGAKTAMDDVLTGLGAFSPNFEDHAPMVLVGDGRTGEWSRFYGFPSADRIVEQVNLLRAARNKLAGD